jgi:hypothetical protein
MFADLHAGNTVLGVGKVPVRLLVKPCSMWRRNIEL